jgi:alkylation response protein AidB-like acyl-CoA dehydrogenase
MRKEYPMDRKEDMEGKKQSMEIAEEAREKEWRYPSFGGLLFMGKFNPNLLHPFPKQNLEDKEIGDQFIEKITSYLEKHLDPNKVDVMREIPKEIIEELGKMGAFAIKIPKEYGGLGLSQINYNRVVMKVASYCASTAVLLSAHQSIGVPQPLKMFGTEAQKKKYFPLFREGKISAFALTEPEVGSDPAKMSAEAKLSEDGKYYILNGTKLWCTNGTVADVIIVMAKTAPKIIQGKEKKQISAFILEMKTPGIKVVHRCEFMGLGGIYNGMLKFTDVKIPSENLLWEEGRGLAMALATINVGRLTLPAACTGAAKQCLSISRRWGKDRIQWGLPIGLHESGRDKLAYISATILAMEAMSWLTCAWSDQTTADIRIEAAMAKLFCTESLWKIVDMTMQLRGGRGYEKATSLIARGEVGYPVERIMRDCRVNLILEGSTEIMKLFLAREAMDPHLKILGDLIKMKQPPRKIIGKVLKLLGYYSLWYTKEWLLSFTSKSYSKEGDLAKYFRFSERCSHKLARYLVYYMGRYGKELERRQMILGRLVEIGTDLFAISATCSYALSLQKEKSEDSSPIHLADYFCKMAKRRIHSCFRALSNNDDKQANQIAKSVINNEYRWLEEGIVWMGPNE